MRLDNRHQALALLLALAFGLCAGLLYDLLRPPRWQRRAMGAFALDALYCLTLGIALFFYAMSLGDGRVGIGALAAAWTGFLFYHRWLSPLCLPIFVKVFQVLDAQCKNIKEIGKKLWFFGKKIFKKFEKCFIVRR